MCVEGPNGVGKTYLVRALAARLGPDCQLLAELTDAQGEHVSAQVIAALSAAGDAFLSTGHPLTETFALLALKVREHELVTRMLAPPAIVLEDRSVDTVAIYQAAIMLGDHATDEGTWTLAQQIYQTAAQWRPVPDFDYDDLSRKTSERAAAVLPVHLWGRAGDLTRLCHFADDRGLVVVADACQALGTTINGTQVGTEATVGCYSTHRLKLLSTGEGGFLTTNDDDLAASARAYREHCPNLARIDLIDTVRLARHLYPELAPARLGQHAAASADPRTR